VGGDEAGEELLAAYRFARACARARGYFISLLVLDAVRRRNGPDAVDKGW